jgi:hypothetical protein
MTINTIFYYCPECVETRLHPQPFRDNTGRLLCGACWFCDGNEIEMIECDDIFPSDIFDDNGR